MPVNHTHNPELKSWVESANRIDTDFPIQNLPFAVLRRSGSHEPFRVAVAIGDFALDLTAVRAAGVISSAGLDACLGSSLNQFMTLGKVAWSALRRELSSVLAEGYGNRKALEPCLIPLAEVEYALPASIGDYTDFFTSIHHATNIGKLFRPDNPLLPNYEWVPIAYHGRSSSIGISGQSVSRPVGQLKQADRDQPIVAPSRKLDYELEVGIFVGAGNPLGQPVPIEQAEDHIFGLCLLNDWSARDIQTWEYQPLGPFLAKNFATTISPWIVTVEALAPFRSPFTRDADRHQPLPYLSSQQNSDHGAVDMQLEVLIRTAKMQHGGAAPKRLSLSNFTDSFWTMAQMLTHHTVNGCNLQPGDLFGSGTMSGSGEGSQGALIEITKGGTSPVQISADEERTFLEDGDTVIMRARSKRKGSVSIGFGEVTGTVEAAPSADSINRNDRVSG
jgi:fumarylacetoacetase